MVAADAGLCCICCFHVVCSVAAGLKVPDPVPVFAIRWVAILALAGRRVLDRFVEAWALEGRMVRERCVAIFALAGRLVRPAESVWCRDTVTV
jgi:hypothetical protein